MSTYRLVSALALGYAGHQYLTPIGFAKANIPPRSRRQTDTAAIKRASAKSRAKAAAKKRGAA